MDPRRLAKIEGELEELQRAPHGKSPRVFVRLAKKLGRQKAKRGKEPTYDSPDVPDLGPPLSIPNHDFLKIGTALSILNTLQSDVDVWRQYLDQQPKIQAPEDAGDDKESEKDEGSET